MKQLIDVIIPVYNEEDSIGNVIKDIPSFVREIIVVDNNSTDQTEEIAKNSGATVVRETHQGYGSACLKGMDYISEKESKPNIVVFLDGDYSDHPEQMEELIKPITESQADMVIGSRTLGNLEKGAMMPQQIFGNRLATTLLKFLYRANFTDLGPFRAIKYNKLVSLNMCDEDFGWTVEMQIKAVKNKLKYLEVPVDYRKRIGVSKITGTIKGTIMAGYKIISTIFKYR